MCSVISFVQLGDSVAAREGTYFRRRLEVHAYASSWSFVAVFQPLRVRTLTNQPERSQPMRTP